MDNSLCFSLITWLKTFPCQTSLTPSNLTDGVALGTILNQIAPEYFSDQWLTKIRTDVADNWRLKVSNLKKIYQGVMDFFYHTELPVQALQQFPTPDVNKIVEHEDRIELGRLLQLILGCAINCDQKQKHIEGIMKMEESVQTLIVNAIQDLMNAETVPGSPELSGGATSSGAWLGPASFNPPIKALTEQLEAMSLAKEDMARRCNELDLQITVLSEEKRSVKEENAKLVERIEILEVGEDIGGQSFRNKDLRKQVESLQDELFKIESSRDEFRSRVERLDKENNELTSRMDELQALADEARTLKDEVDALRDMSDRVAVYEGTVETYKKKLEELSDLKRQVKILEEKNSEYMHQNMELEEEVKKSGTWRPQLDLYKKQVSDLHQKLADEGKKTDRQIVENKKMMDKLEALTQEKERVILERDMLKENVEELKCTVSALSSPDAASRSPSDLSDIDTLEIIPPEIREKLVRLQHENRVLKQRANDKNDESSSVLQSLLNDLQDRHDKILLENRWEKISPPLTKYIHPQWPPVDRTWPLDSYLATLDPPHISKSVKVLKRNLKWASESDLLILRQSPPLNFINQVLSSSNKKNIHSPESTHISSNLHSPSNNASKDTPIVIRHIHEFKMASSPTNEDSGCCRTSPSSCEGCDDHLCGSYGIQSPDYGGTLDSGVSGMFRCLSPMIPSIVEECSANHVSDILPAILGQEKTVPSSFICSAYSLHTNANEVQDKFNVQALKTSSLPNSNVSVSKSSFSCHCQNYFSSSSNSSFTQMSANGDETVLPVKSYRAEKMTSDSVPFSPALQSSKSLPQRPQPPGSPTPHNSPKLPHSIHSIRSKGSKQSLNSPPPYEKFNSGSLSNIYSRTLINVDVTNNNEARKNYGNKEQIQHQMNEISTLTYNSDPVSQTRRHSHSQTEKSRVGYLETDLDLHLQSRVRPSLKEYRAEKEKPKSGILKKLRSKSLDKSYMEENKLSIPKDYMLEGTSDEILYDKHVTKDVIDDNITCVEENKSDIQKERVRYVGNANPSLTSLTNANPNKVTNSFSTKLNKRGENLVKNKSQLKTKLDQTGAALYSNSNQRRQIDLFSPSGNSPRIFRDKSIHSYSRNENPSRLLHTTSKSFSNSSNSILYLSEGGVALRDKFSYSKGSSSSLNDKQHSKTIPAKNSKISSSEMTLITGTLFNHFMTTKRNVSFDTLSNKTYLRKENHIPKISSSPISLNCFPIPCRSKNRETVTSDTDTDIELVENRLISSAYAAPIVSSDSSTSIHHSDTTTDLDPSATDYCTETDTDFDPRQYKLLTMETNRKSPMKCSELEALIGSSPCPVVRPTSYFQKKKSQMILASKKKLKNGGVIKVKNKTARALAAETFNAMFLFCTP